jgi:hypothetical protein
MSEKSEANRASLKDLKCLRFVFESFNATARKCGTKRFVRRDYGEGIAAERPVFLGSGGAIHAFPPPPSELFIVIRRERKAA